MSSTMQRSDSQFSAQQQASDFKVITPLYKTFEKPHSELTTGSASLNDLSRKYAESNGDYKAERQQESFRMQIIDPKVDSNAYIPAHGQSQFPRHRSLIDDFPSQHNKLSMLNLNAMEQRKIRSVETRPITTNAYLNESVDRHRAMEASKLREHLKTNEHEANKLWNKPARPEQNEESLRELEQIRKSIETLQRMKEEHHYQSVLPDPGFLVRLRKQRYLDQLAKDQQSFASHANRRIKASQPRKEHTSEFVEEEHYEKVTTHTFYPNFRRYEEYAQKRMPEGQQPQKSILKNSFKMVPPPAPPPMPMNLSYKNQPTIRLKTKTPDQPLRQVATSPQNHVNYEAYDEQVALQTMHENLRRHRQQSQTPQPSKAPTTSFNGPFFRLEEVSPSSSNNQTYNQFNSQQHERYQTLSRQEFSPNQDYRPTYGTSGETVVIWPPPSSSSSDRPRPASVTPKNIADPERIAIFERQKQQELEAMRLEEEKKSRSQEKQYYASQLQQQRIQSRIEHQRRTETISPTSTNLPTANVETPLIGSDPGPAPNLRIYETRPISALSDGFSLNPSWKQTYLVDEHKEIAAKNEILRSDEVLEREQFDIDLLQRREAFIEKPEFEPPINRLGRRWQPPPEKPYIWPHTVGNEAIEHKWEPVIENPAYKYERKQFAPSNSPPPRGRGTRSLDEVAQRQTKNVIQPSPDGSHRPKPAFKVSRSTPSGGFVPHAPNAVKLVKKRDMEIQGSSPNSINQQERDVQMIHESTYHLINDPTPRTRNSESDNVNDWEKIYDLPAHSSTITNKDPRPNIDVRKRLQLFERYAKKRSQSAHHTPETYNHKPLHISTSSPISQKEPVSNGGNLLKTTKNSSKPVPQIRKSIDPNHLHPDYSPERAPSARSQHNIRRIIEATQPSPPPASYEHARKYVPPALPSGHRLSRTPQRRSPPPQHPGNTRRLMQVVQTAASSHQHSRPLSATLYPSGTSHPRSSYQTKHQASSSAFSPSTHKYL